MLTAGCRLTEFETQPDFARGFWVGDLTNCYSISIQPLLSRLPETTGNIGLPFKPALHPDSTAQRYFPMIITPSQRCPQTPRALVRASTPALRSSCQPNGRSCQSRHVVLLQCIRQRVQQDRRDARWRTEFC